MADRRLPDLATLINRQLISHEDLTECLSKAEALISVALSQDFLNQDKSIIHDYLITLGDLVVHAKVTNEGLHDVLLQNRLLAITRVN